MHDKAARFPGRDVGRLYTATALTITTTLLLFLLVNLAALLVAPHADQQGGQTQPPYTRAWLIDAYGLDTLARAYPDLSRSDAEAFLYETSNWFQEYEPFTGFRPVAREDRFITITREGFRPVPDQAPWPPDSNSFTVFLFGGSTMMGAGVPDNQTIAAHLQRTLERCAERPRVYNFGRGFYFSTQERILFEQLLLSGHVPDVAVFLDGLNDFFFAEGVPQFTDQLRQFMERDGREAPQSRPWQEAASEVVRALPIWRLAVRSGLVSAVPAPDPPAPAEATGRSDDERIQGVIERWTRNHQMIESVAAEFGVRVAMVWQPVPTYSYDVTKLNVYRPGVELFGAHRLSGLGYPRVASSFGARAQDGRVLWLGDMQRQRSENLYVDAIHYTGAFSAEIGSAIADFVTARAIVPCAR